MGWEKTSEMIKALDEILADEGFFLASGLSLSSDAERKKIRLLISQIYENKFRTPGHLAEAIRERFEQSNTQPDEL